MRCLIAGNWKMHGLKAQVREIRTLALSVQSTQPPVDILICPPATLIDRAVQAADGKIAIGGQDCHAEVSGPFTGDISAQMLRDDGATAVIVGHSERRRDYGETDDIVSAKARAARQSGLMAMVCVGESKSVRDTGDHLAFCAGQVIASVPHGFSARDCAIAYEPLWAIGKDEAAGPEDIVEMHANIRQTLVRHLGADGAHVRILYGGSVTPENTRQILSLPEVNGVLVGRGSLAFANFEAIISAASAVQRQQQE